MHALDCVLVQQSDVRRDTDGLTSTVTWYMPTLIVRTSWAGARTSKSGAGGRPRSRKPRDGLIASPLQPNAQCAASIRSWKSRPR
ncbi:hypothetical protein GY14_32595 [Delftia tsuruhatensis]|nr:hypothetical protein GY14_32595 [Delftia tsuruhatensis]